LFPLSFLTLALNTSLENLGLEKGVKRLTYATSDLDEAHNDKKHFSKNFSLEVYFLGGTCSLHRQYGTTLP